MEPSTLLEHALFQLTPTRTRCDLVIFSGKKQEKIATGLLEPYISHLKSAQDQISRGGYSIDLKPPSDSPWFTKATLQRFVRFVSTPELLERFVTIEREMDQIETSNGTSDHFPGNASSADGDRSSLPSESAEETPKVRLQRVLESRKAMLKKEQAMAYARALVAGFETDSLYDLVSFSDAFGAQRLREACLNFVQLCNKKREDKIWMDEVEKMKMQASYMGSPTVSFSAETDEKGSSPTVQGFIETSQGTNNAFQTELNSHHPHYTLHGQAPMFQPYPGYVFPGMPWPANFHNPGPPLDTSPKKQTSRKKKEKHEDDSDTDYSSSRSNSSEEKVNRKKKKHKKKSSKKVIIRNINYVASSRNEKDSNGSESYNSSDESLKMKDSNKSNKGICIIKEGNLVTSEEEEKKDGNWDIFQNLLMQEPDSNSADTGSKSMQIQQEFASDDFLFTERNGFGEEEQYPYKAHFSADHSIIKTRQEEDLIVSTNSETRNANIDDHDIFSGDQASIQESKKVVLSDDSFMVQSRASDILGPTQPMHDDIFMVTDIVGSNQSKNNSSYEPEDLKMMLGHDHVTEEAVVSWSHDMETTVTSHVKSKPSDDNVVDEAKQQLGNDKPSKTKAVKDSGRKVVGKESKKAPTGSLGRSKSDIPPRSKMSASRSKSETEEEKRKKMEQLSKQRQKRIAERSAAKGAVTPEASRRSAKEVKKMTSVPSKEKPRTLTNQERKKSDKPVVMRSSTIDRLASSRTTKEPSLGQTKKPTPSVKVTKGTQKQQKVIKVNPSDKKNGSKNDSSKMISSEKSEQNPTESGVVVDSETVKVLEKRGSVDSISEVVLTRPHEIAVSPTDEKVGGDKKRLTFSSDVSVLEISSSTTPPQELENEMNLEHSRKKWNNGESSPKIPKGFRRLLLFGRRT